MRVQKNVSMAKSYQNDIGIVGDSGTYVYDFEHWQITPEARVRVGR
jgi:hypothetical protein